MKAKRGCAGIQVEGPSRRSGRGRAARSCLASRLEMNLGEVAATTQRSAPPHAFCMAWNATWLGEVGVPSYLSIRDQSAQQNYRRRSTPRLSRHAAPCEVIDRGRAGGRAAVVRTDAARIRVSELGRDDRNVRRHPRRGKRLPRRAAAAGAHGVHDRGDRDGSVQLDLPRVNRARRTLSRMGAQNVRQELWR
jgi:hypothetical protein